ncbi:MAG: TIGR03663 family protein [Pyrinomonadaceae bacterium]|nr:TIGR03663 family protein [Pyrinomonadaceae bacterium]
MKEESENFDNGTATGEGAGKFDLPWLAGCGAVTAVATFLRFYMLGLKPFHHDEGVNGFFLKTLFDKGTYAYDPANYHGPTLYYISLAFSKVFGLNTLSVRWSVAIFGVLTVVLALYLRRYLGKIGALTAALFLSISPGMVYISRYFIHEMFFVFCSLAVVVAVVLFIEKRKAGLMAVVWMSLILLVAFLPSSLNLASTLGGENASALWAFRVAFFIVETVLVFFVMRMLLAWEDGRPIYLLLASASAAMMFATKETAFITLGTMLIAVFCVWLWRKITETELFSTKKILIIGVVHGAVILAAMVYSQKLVDGYEFLSAFFIGEGRRPQEPFTFYLVIALIVATIISWAVFLYVYRQNNVTELAEDGNLTWAAFRSGIGNGTDLLLIVAASVTVFVYLNALFFSSFFSYAEGVQKAFEAYAIWTKTGNKDHTQNGMLAYVKWGMKVESPLLLLSALGVGIALLRAKHRFAIFSAFWAVGMFLAYTIIPYKTPWLALSFYLPMCIIAGYGINELVTAKRTVLKVAGIALVATGSVILAYQAYSINFVRYDDEEMGYVYAHTKREMLDLVAKIEYYAEKSPKGKDVTIEIVSPDYWPLTWYLKDFEHANFHGALVDANASELIIAKKDAQESEVMRRYSAHYKFVDVYPLRPGVDLMLLVKKDLADPDAKELYKMLEYVSPELRP